MPCPSGPSHEAPDPSERVPMPDAGAQEWLVVLDERASQAAEPPGDGDHRIVAVHSGKVLDVFGASTASGALLIQWPWHGGDNQRFHL
jgi:Ricin-type beta-trefoil lectin domain-like